MFKLNSLGSIMYLIQGSEGSLHDILISNK